MKPKINMEVISSIIKRQAKGLIGTSKRTCAGHRLTAHEPASATNRARHSELKRSNRQPQPSPGAQPQSPAPRATSSSNCPLRAPPRESADARCGRGSGRAPYRQCSTRCPTAHSSRSRAGTRGNALSWSARTSTSPSLQAKSRTAQCTMHTQIIARFCRIRVAFV